MEQGRVRRYSRKERQGVNEGAYDRRSFWSGNRYADRDAGCADDSYRDACTDTQCEQRGYEDSRYEEPSYGGSSRYNCGSRRFQSKHGDSGLRAALDYVANSRIKVRKNGRTIAKVPASFGIAGVIGSIFNRRLAWVGAIGLAGALSAGYRLELDVENHQEKPH